MADRLTLIVKPKPGLSIGQLCELIDALKLWRRDRRTDTWPPDGSINDPVWHVFELGEGAS